MSVFKLWKRDRDDAVDEDAPDDDDAAVDAATDDVDEPSLPVGLPPRPHGPWDVSETPEREVPRIDLGALRVPVEPGVDMRVDVSPQGDVVAATVVRGDSALQLSAFAAPRTEGIWAEVREEIAAALQEGGGQVTTVEGPFGAELRAQVPTQVPDHGVVLAPARFVGVDGPRWFLRGLITGAGATDPARAPELEAAFRDVVVVRGSDPMAVRDPLPLRLPKDVAEQAAAEQAAAQAAAAPATAPPERGPEITEIR